MINDVFLRVSDSQAPTQGATTVSTDSIDLGDVTPKRRIGDGEPLAMVFNVESRTASADTYTFQVISATAAALNAGVKIVARTRILTAAEIPAGTLVVLPIPPGEPDQRYLGASYILGANDALAVSASLMALKDVPKGNAVFHASGVLVS